MYNLAISSYDANLESCWTHCAHFAWCYPVASRIFNLARKVSKAAAAAAAAAVAAEEQAAAAAAAAAEGQVALAAQGYSVN